jgi:hypothetical protein
MEAISDDLVQFLGGLGHLAQLSCNRVEIPRRRSMRAIQIIDVITYSSGSMAPKGPSASIHPADLVSVQVASSCAPHPKLTASCDPAAMRRCLASSSCAPRLAAVHRDLRGLSRRQGCQDRGSVVPANSQNVQDEARDRHRSPAARLVGYERRSSRPNNSTATCRTCRSAASRSLSPRPAQRTIHGRSPRSNRPERPARRRRLWRSGSTCVSQQLDESEFAGRRRDGWGGLPGRVQIQV